jgi:hypothetical protein
MVKDIWFWSSMVKTKLRQKLNGQKWTFSKYNSSRCENCMFYFVIVSSFSYNFSQSFWMFDSWGCENCIFYGTEGVHGDDIWLICVSFNSTLESLPLLSAIEWATVSPLTRFGIKFVGTFPFPVLLILSFLFFLQLMFSLPCFCYKKDRRLSVLLTCFLLL